MTSSESTIPAPTLDRIRKRSVIVSGHRTSVSLEETFWEALAELASERGVSINQLVTEIDRENPANLSSAIRVYILKTFRERKVNSAQPP